MTTALEPSLMLAAADVELMASGRPPTISVVGYTGGMKRVPPFGALVTDLEGLDYRETRFQFLPTTTVAFAASLDMVSTRLLFIQFHKTNMRLPRKEVIACSKSKCVIGLRLSPHRPQEPPGESNATESETAPDTQGPIPPPRS